MTKPKTKKLVIIALVVILSIPMGYYTLRKTTPFFNFLFPPQDLFTPLASASVDFKNTGNTYTLDFQHIYPGNHGFDIKVEKPLEGNSRFCAREYELQIDVLNKGKVVKSKTIKAPCNETVRNNLKTTGSSQNRFWYSVPRDLPMGEPLQASIKVIKADLDFDRYHGKAIVVARKFSDE
jgi:hypothetical protein